VTKISCICCFCFLPGKLDDMLEISVFDRDEMAFPSQQDFWTHERCIREHFDSRVSLILGKLLDEEDDESSG